MDKSTVPEKYLRYAEDVVSGKIVAGKWIVLACRRYLSWFDRPDMWFDAGRIDRILEFFKHIRHFEGDFNKKSFYETFLPWEIFLICNIFGWYRSDDRAKRVVRNVFMLISRKNGKALALDTPVPTPSGWRSLSEVRPGDFVFGADGRPVRVLAESPVYENHDCYKLEFSDGGSLVADAGHKWLVKSPATGKRLPFVATTEEMFARGVFREKRRGGRAVKEYFWRIPLHGAVDYPEKNLPVDPYVLGLWLGDGSCGRGLFTVAESKRECYERWVNPIYGAPHVLDHSNPNVKCYSYVDSPERSLRLDLKKAGVLREKRIPDIYKFASRAQRLSLLRGLMDADGTVKKGRYGQCRIVQKRAGLGRDIAELARSLGYLVTERPESPNSGYGGPLYEVTFCASKEMPPFRRADHLSKLPEKLSERSKWVSVVGIEKAPSVPTKCLCVDSPDHLWLAGKSCAVTHNSSISAAIMLADMIVNKEPGYQGILVANTREQAKILFKFVSGFARSLDPKHRHIKIYRDSLKYDKTHSSIKVISSDSFNSDGLNPSTFIADEFAASPDYLNYNVLKSGQAMRKNPLSITISSAGFLLDTYPCYEQCKVGQRLLRGEIEDDSWFYAIYQLDEGDDYKDEKVWTKACPSYPAIVNRDYMLERIKEAEQSPQKLTDVKTKNFNVWCAAASTWLESSLLKENDAGTLDMDALAGETCYVGMDLSATRDLTSIAALFPPDPDREYMPDKFVWKWYVWIPQYACRTGANSGLYQWYVDSGQAKMTAGNSVDYEVVIAQIGELAKKYNVAGIYYDQWNATMAVQALIADGYNMVPFGQGLGSFNRPTKTFEILITQKRCALEFQPLLLWMFSHCELKMDHAENVKPIKAADNPLNKIDAIIAILEALGGYIMSMVQTTGDVIDLPLSPGA